jgi:hypothetical protein
MAVGGRVQTLCCAFRSLRNGISRNCAGRVNTQPPTGHRVCRLLITTRLLTHADRQKVRAPGRLPRMSSANQKAHALITCSVFWFRNDRRKATLALPSGHSEDSNREGLPKVSLNRLVQPFVSAPLADERRLPFRHRERSGFSHYHYPLSRIPVFDCASGNRIRENAICDIATVHLR